MDLATRLDNIRVRVRAPTAEIEAELYQRTAIRLSFGRRVYASMHESELEEVLARIAKLLWVGWQREYRRALEYTTLVIDADDSTDLKFFADRDSTEATGESNDQRITVSTVGMKDFSVRISPETIYQLSESQFSASVSEAAANLIQDFQTKVDEVKKRYYDY
ncbi:hypothetical protein ACFYV7_39395 [Nocardia suismassiliense]|uniref:Uncharacterized protein n=1 Tax=Nocardia suismassiliense TaxID=2077092 RepID=A0ABW6R5W4_9NOCA